MTAPERMDLAAFLARIDDTEAARLRAAAARIDELARVGNAMEGIERSYVPWAAVAGLAFLAGLWFFVNPGTVSPAITVACLGALPLVAAHYAWRVMARTRADQQAHELNVRHFLPHGGLYFPAGGGRPACVMRVEPKKLSPQTLRGHKITRRDIWW
jgi:hypothetical protein